VGFGPRGFWYVDAGMAHHCIYFPNPFEKTLSTFRPPFAILSNLSTFQPFNLSTFSTISTFPTFSTFSTGFNLFIQSLLTHFNTPRLLSPREAA
jgi:hypothetical protein